MDQIVTDTADIRAEIARLEEEIEAASARIESCRKVIWAARGLVVASVLVLGFAVVMTIEPFLLIGAIAGVLGGLVLLGSNRTTAAEAEAQLAEAHARRAALISQVPLRVVS